MSITAYTTPSPGRVDSELQFDRGGGSCLNYGGGDQKTPRVLLHIVILEDQRLFSVKIGRGCKSFVPNISATPVCWAAVVMMNCVVCDSGQSNVAIGMQPHSIGLKVVRS